MRLPRSIPAAILILLVLMPCIYCVYFQAEQQITKHRMREKLESEDLQTVLVPVKEFRWYEENREILVHGMMFDVKSISRQGDNYMVTGLFDEYETELNVALGKLQHHQDDDNATHIYQVLTQVLIDHSPAIGLHCEYNSCDADRLILPGEKLYNTWLSLHTPPPRV